MQFSTFSEFINMGGHGLYVWLAYGIALAIITANILMPILARKALINNLVRRARREKRQASSQESQKL
ncbi:heme exporter protein CcmD [Neptunomonas phycophila]|uniref:heme exporter protein CcmD n=1 Tax=Neptunomonas phycophila TaxID=1572645 RepID=UPI0023FA26EC|nr:heme exporter protein CcmD [Neptunomonas phycophila]